MFHIFMHLVSLITIYTITYHHQNIAKGSIDQRAECSHPFSTFWSYHKLTKLRFQNFAQCCQLARLQIKRQPQRKAHAWGCAAREDDCRKSSRATRQIRCKRIIGQTQPMQSDMSVIYIRTGRSMSPRQSIVKV